MSKIETYREDRTEYVGYVINDYNKRLICPYCKKEFKDTGLLIIHMDLYHK